MFRHDPKYMRGALEPDKKVPFERVQSDIGKCLFAAPFCNNKIVLDVACGTGHISSYLKRNAKRVIGGDVSRQATAYATSHYRKDALHFILLDARHLPFGDGSFDVVVSMETIEHLPEFRWFLHECRRVLKCHAAFICSTPNKGVASPDTRKTSSSSHAQEFYPQEFCQLLEEYFSEVILYGQIPKNTVERLYLRLRTLFLPFFILIPQVQKFVTSFWSLASHHTALDVEELDEDDFDRIFDKTYWPSRAQASSLSTLTMIAVARKAVEQAEKMEIKTTELVIG